MNPNSAPWANEIDAAIDCALSTIRETQPRPGLNTRILTSLEDRAEHRATNPGGLPFRVAKGWGIVRRSERENARRATSLPLVTAAAAAVIAIASLAILHHHLAPTQSGPNTSASRESEAGVSPGLAAGFSPLNTSTESKGASAPAHSYPGLAAGFSPLNTRAKRSGALAPACIPDHQPSACLTHNVVAVAGDVTADPDAQALADLHAPSHPAPPLPLTAQEKLFLRMLRYGNATELAELNPLVRAKHDADETAAFKAFFPDPPPLQQPLGDAE